MDKFSKYLKKKKPLVRMLIEKLAHEYEFVSVLGTDVKGKIYYVDKSSVVISSSSITECGFVLRVFYKGVYSEYSFSELEEKSIDKIINEINTLVNENVKTSKVNAKPIQEEELVKKFRRKDNSAVHSPEELTTLLKEYSDYGMKLNDKVINVKVGFENNEVSKMYLSTKRDLEQYYTWNNSHCFALVRDGQNMKYYYNMDGYAKVDEALESFKGMIDDEHDGQRHEGRHGQQKQIDGDLVRMKAFRIKACFLHLGTAAFRAGWGDESAMGDFPWGSGASRPQGSIKRFIFR